MIACMPAPTTRRLNWRFALKREQALKEPVIGRSDYEKRQAVSQIGRVPKLRRRKHLRRQQPVQAFLQ